MTLRSFPLSTRRPCCRRTPRCVLSWHREVVCVTMCVDCSQNCDYRYTQLLLYCQTATVLTSIGRRASPSQRSRCDLTARLFKCLKLCFVMFSFNTLYFHESQRRPEISRNRLVKSTIFARTPGATVKLESPLPGFTSLYPLFLSFSFSRSSLSLFTIICSFIHLLIR